MAYNNKYLLRAVNMWWRCAQYFVIALVYVGFRDGGNVSELSYVCYYVVVKSNFKHAHEECQSKRAFVF